MILGDVVERSEQKKKKLDWDGEKKNKYEIFDWNPEKLTCFFA